MGYPRQVHEKAWSLLAARRDEARERMSRRRGDIREKIADIAIIERKMASGAAGITKAMIASPEKAGDMIEALGRENLALQKQRAALLAKNGYPADYLDDKPYCARCGDSGYIGAEMCECLAALIKEQAYAYLDAFAPSGLGSFADFELSFYPDAPEEGGVNPQKRMGEIYGYCANYADSFSKDSESLLFLGKTGLGKTHLSVAIARAVTDKGFGVLYTPVQKLMDRLESEKFSRVPGSGEQYMANMEIVLECDLLIFDDLGSEFSTSFTASSLFHIVNSRIVERKPTIINTNLEPQGIEQRYSQRMVSRLLCEYRALKFYGKDIRFLKKMNARKG